MQRNQEIYSANQYVAHVMPHLPNLQIGPVSVEVGFHVFRAGRDHRSTDLHQHVWWDVSMIRSGRIKYTVDGRKVTPGEADVTVIPAGVRHGWKALGNASVVSESFMLTLSSLEPVGARILQSMSARAAAHAYCFRLSPSVARRREELWQTLMRKEDYSLNGLRIGLLLHLFTVEFIASVFEEEFTAIGRAFEVDLGQPDDEVRLAVRLQKHVCEHLHEKLKLEDLEEEFGYSKRHLSRIFRQKMATSIHEFLLDKRLKAACDLLVNTDLRVNEIAFRAGFEDVSYFCKIFHKRLQHTPLSFRRSHRAVHQFEKHLKEKRGEPFQDNGDENG